MGQIDYYNRLYTNKPGIKQIIAIQAPDVAKSTDVLPLAELHDITLAQYSAVSREVITAHKLKDYRRKQFNFVLLPKVETTFNKLLEGSKYWHELLENESAYS